MTKLFAPRVAALFLGCCTLPSLAADFTMDQLSAMVEPSTRLQANTTYFGWDNFEDPAPGTFLNDTTPDIGNTEIVGVRFETTNGQLHRAPSTGNFYSGSSTATAEIAEKVTVVTSGTVGPDGMTTIIAQLVAANGNFISQWTFGDINDVEPQVIHGVNAQGRGQVWVKWVVPGNAASYEFTIGGAVHPMHGNAHMSFDKIAIDTFWGPEAQEDTMRATTPALARFMDQEEDIVAPSTRGNLKTTHFGWDDFEDPAPGTFLEDSTPDLGNEDIVGVKFETTNGQLHRAPSSGNFYSGSSTATAEIAEKVTVVTSGTVGATGFTTIIAQLVAGSGNFISQWTFGDINGVNPAVVHGVNALGRGQVWVKWVVPGNAATYEFTIGGVQHPMFGNAHMSFNKIEIDTLWSATAQGDTMEAQTVEIVTESLADATKGTAYSATLEAEGGEAPHTWALVGTTQLPGGLTLSADGVISGTPTALGLFEFTVVAESADGYEAETDLSINVHPGLVYHFTLKGETGIVVPSTRGAVTSTHFGWDDFEDPAPGTFLEDSTPDLGDTAIAGVKFETTNGQLHRAPSSGNFYSGSDSATAEIAEKVTVVTNGTVGETGQTTIIAQLIAGSGNFISSWTFGSIGDVSPEIIQGANAAGKGQVWVKWVVPGNAATYDFTIGSTAHPMFGSAHMSFDKIEIDTFYSEEVQPGDTMILEEPAAIATNMDQATGIVAPSSRGTAGTTYFGWDTFGTIGVSAPIDDNTPDIGTYAGTLARFRTTNEETHQFSGGGNLYFLSGTLAEEVTVPTNGVVGEAGFTTIFLQIASSQSGMGGGTFAADITTAINGVPPTLAVQGGSANSAQYWAKWELPGNQATYAITIAGPEGQAHFSFDKVVVDTKFSPYGFVADTMKAKTVEITTETLADAVKGQLYNVQLEAEGGTLPHTWSLAAESELPAGLTLSSSGVISGTPSTLEEVTFTVITQDAEEYEAEKTYTLAVVSGIEIVTTELPVGVIGREYSVQFEAVDGLAPYEWAVTEGTLPAGLTLSTTGLLSGTPSEEATTSLTFTVTDAEESTKSQVIELVVSTSLLKPVMNPVAFGATTVGADFAYTLSAANYPKQFNVTGLPTGLKVDRATGVISGRAPVAGVYLVQVSATNTAGTSAVVSAPLVVSALPATQVGTFTGLIARDATANAGLGSMFTLTTTGKGTFTVKVKSGSATKSAKGFLASAAPQVQVAVNGTDLALTLNAETGLVTGTYGAAAVNGWLNVWDKKMNPPSSREGFYSVVLDLADEDDLGAAAIPQGLGHATFGILPAGTVKIIGKSADGQPLTSSTTMGPNGELALYATQYANKGTLLGTLTVDEDEDGLFMGNDVSGSLTWLKPAGKGRIYAAGFGPVDLAAEGGYLGAATKRPVILGLPATGAFDMVFESAGVDASATDADVTGALWTEAYKADFSDAVNAGKVALKVNKSTGAVTGSLTLTETTPPLVRKGIKFQGQVVRMSDGQVKAAGYFLLPQIATDGQKANTTSILSGSFLIRQPVIP
jgi:hypothetical protein